MEKEKIGRDWNVDDLATAIELAPTVDAVPVVRCRDCVWYTDNGRDAPICDNLHRMYIHRSGDWFCANGERRDKTDETHDRP